MAGELVLVIEDNDRNRKLAQDVLEFAGFRVVAAATAADGLALARKHGPDLVLMDVQLPDADGVDAMRRLRTETASDVPVVAVTAFAMKGDRERLLSAGFDGYISKPIDVKEFAGQIGAFLAPDASPAPRPKPKLLVVDDTAANVRLLAAMLEPRGYHVVGASSGEEALERVRADRPDLVLLDVQMPGLDGYDVCRRIRSNPETATLPVIMVTASVGHERLKALESGADDFVQKPLNQAELLARVGALVRIKDYQDRLEEKSSELSVLNSTLQARVDAQVGEVERLRGLRRFLSPQVADAILSGGDDSILDIHRREIAVLFCDLRGFTAFTGSVEPEEAMSALLEFHEELGGLVNELDATVGHFAGDGIMFFFNDPMPCPDPAMRAVRLALAIRDAMTGVTSRWRRFGHSLGCGVGISFGYATLGLMGFEARRDYGAVGSTVNLASRLCDEAQDGQILIGQRAYAAVEDQIDAERVVPDLQLKGFREPVPAWSIRGLKA